MIPAAKRTAAAPSFLVRVAASLAALCALAAADPCGLLADEAAAPPRVIRKAKTAPRPLLTTDQWKILDRAVDRGLEYLSKNQEANGSFAAPVGGQPGITSLCVMAMLARGHQPGMGLYGAQIERAIDYTLQTQDPRTGTIMFGNNEPWFRDARTANYNHGIAGIMLAEVYGMTHADRHERIRKTILKALEYTRTQQVRRKPRPEEEGGWRYKEPRPEDADLSVTAWQLMFLRSARNAEFDVPQSWIKEALGFVHQSFDADKRAFTYTLAFNRRSSRGMVGAGIVCLELSGEHGSETARIAGDWILRHPFGPYGGRQYDGRYHYGAFYCSQAMFQLGGDYWHLFFPELLKSLADGQHDDGSWDVEQKRGDNSYGNVYTSALAVLALATPYQILPIYQR